MMEGDESGVGMGLTFADDLVMLQHQPAKIRRAPSDVQISDEAMGMLSIAIALHFSLIISASPRWRRTWLLNTGHTHTLRSPFEFQLHSDLVNQNVNQYGKGRHCQLHRRRTSHIQLLPGHPHRLCDETAIVSSVSERRAASTMLPDQGDAITLLVDGDTLHTVSTIGGGYVFSFS